MNQDQIIEDLKQKATMIHQTIIWWENECIKHLNLLEKAENDGDKAKAKEYGDKIDALLKRSSLEQAELDKLEIKIQDFFSSQDET